MTGTSWRRRRAAGVAEPWLGAVRIEPRPRSGTRGATRVPAETPVGSLALQHAGRRDQGMIQGPMPVVTSAVQFCHVSGLGRMPPIEERVEPGWKDDLGVHPVVSTGNIVPRRHEFL